MVTKAKKKPTKRKAKDIFRQTGKSKGEADVMRKAKAPGKRISKSGKVYTERRKNRSDKKNHI